MSTSECYPDKAPKVNTVLDTLSNELRREIIHYFENFAPESTVSFDTLIGHIEGRVPGKESDSLEIELRHTHLPVLQSRGWITFDPTRMSIRYHGHENVEQLLNEVIEVFSSGDR